MMKPYDNEAESIGIGDLTIENRVDRVQIYGSVELTRDKGGLEKARELKELLDAIVKKLEGEDLPDTVTIEKPKSVDNPFK
ncbi:MAG: hypothetical protein ACXV79_00875 [Methylobacter sp.]